MRAVELRFGVVFYRLEDLLTAQKRDADLPPRRLRSKKYLKTLLVIIDEVGFEPMTRQEASLCFRLVSHRYQRGSILITTNKGIRDWPRSSPATSSSPPRSSTGCCTTATCSTSRAAATGCETSNRRYRVRAAEALRRRGRRPRKEDGSQEVEVRTPLHWTRDARSWVSP